MVEDNPLMRDMLTEFLALEASLEVVGVVESAEAALERFPVPSPDLVLIDMSLPGMSGMELIRKLHEQQPGLPCAMLSGHGEKHYVEQAFDAGASGYILKGSRMNCRWQSSRYSLAKRSSAKSYSVSPRGRFAFSTCFHGPSPF
ncbi:response regulator [Modicisalibacter luteus]|uniref:response regulator n=1 Tax=Modicisalibacter luteus TaxID=453962 RepID=UPI003640CDF0